MLFLVLAAYSLLALPVRITLNVQLHGMLRETTVELCAAGFFHRFRMPKKKKRDGKRSQSKAILDAVRGAARVDCIEAFARVGTGDACSSALASGSLRAALFAGIAALGEVKKVRVLVVPDYSQRIFTLDLRYVFFLSAGDLMLSAARLARRKRRKAGMRSSRIPVKI